MAYNVSIYAGSNKAGELRQSALKKEAKRQGKDTAVSEIIWDALLKAGSKQLRTDLLEADRLER